MTRARRSNYKMRKRRLYLYTPPEMGDVPDELDRLWNDPDLTEEEEKRLISKLLSLPHSDPK